MTTAVLGDLFWGPVESKLTPRPSGRRRCVLDVGTGTGRLCPIGLDGGVDADYSAAEGSWVREMAERYEHADFVGVDIVPIPPPASAIAEMEVSSLLKTTYVRDNYSCLCLEFAE
jgi:hypothetical protein